MNSLSIAIIICTRNRASLLSGCLSSIKKQSIQPDELILIEDSSEKKFFSLKKIQEYCPSISTYVYKCIKVKNISISRNVGIRSSSSAIILFIDDDVILTPTYIEQLKQLYRKYPRVESFVGYIRPIDKNYWSFLSEKIMVFQVFGFRKEKRIRFWPMMNFSIRTSFLKKNNIFFDENFKAMESLDFSEMLRKHDCTIIFSPHLFVYHCFRNNIVSYIKTYYWYYSYLRLFSKKYPNNSILTDRIFLTRHNNIWTCMKQFYRIHKYTLHFLSSRRISFLYYPGIALYYITMYVAWKKSNISNGYD